MNKVICTLLLLFCFLGLYSQNDTIYGKVTDNELVPIEYANVVSYLLPDTTFIAGAITDAKGEFRLVTKNINNSVVKVSFIGYKTQFIPAKRKLQIEMESATSQLNEVSVQAIRPKVVFKKDRYEVTIENSMAAQGNTIESLLQDLPGVWATSDGVISINGMSGVQVIVDDKPVRLKGAALMAYLSSFRSEDISKIEVIQRPSAMYDAEGGGIIRIITRKIREEGLSGTVSTKTIVQKFSGISPYLSLKYSKGKFGADLSLNGEKSKWLMLSDTYITSIKNGVNYATLSKDTIFDKNYSVNANLYYDINDYNKLALNINHMYWGKDEHVKGNTDIDGNNSSAIWKTKTGRKDMQGMNHYSFTLNYYLLLDTLGKKKITVLSDFSNQYHYNYKSYYLYQNYDQQGNFISRENLHNDQDKPYQIFSSEIKYDHILSKKSAFKTGVKYSNSTIEHELTNFDKVTGQWLINDSLGYHYQFDEQLVSSFIQFNIDKEHWSLLGGLRGEYTLGHIVDVKQEEEKFNLFPSVYFDYYLDKKNTLGLSYTQRIQRVSYLRLLPQRFYTSRYSMIEGNPLLTPNILNNIGMNYNYDGKCSFSISYRWSDNAISKFNRSEIIGNTSVIVSTYVDGVKTKRANFNAYVPVKLTTWWSTINQLNINYTNYEAETLNSYSNFNYNIYTKQTFYMPLEFRGEILYRYWSPSKSAYTESYPYHLLNASLFKTFYNKKITAKFEVSRILYNQKMGSQSTTSTANVIDKMYGTKMPFFALTLSYSFSKGKSKKFQRIQKSNLQEKSRTY